MDYGMLSGTGKLLQGLAQGIANRKRTNEERMLQAQAASDLQAYLRDGTVRPGLMRIPYGTINALTPQEKQGTPQWVQRPPEGQGPAQLLYGQPQPGDQPYEPTKEKAPKTMGEMTDNELAYLAQTDPKAKALLDERVNRQLKIFGSKEETKANLRPDKAQTVKGIGADGKEKFISIFTDPNTNEVTFKETGVATPPSPVTQRITAGDRQYLTEAEGLTKVIDDIEKNFEDGFVGPIAGRVGEVKSATVGNSKKEASFRAAVSSLKNQLLKLRSGAAVTPSEFERILSELPTENDPVTNFKEKLRQTKENIDLLKRTRTNLQGGANTGNTPRFQIEQVE